MNEKEESKKNVYATYVHVWMMMLINNRNEKSKSKVNSFIRITIFVYKTLGIKMKIFLVFKRWLDGTNPKIDL